MSQNNVNIPSQPDHTLSNLNQSSKDFFLNDFSIASFKIHKEHLEDMEDFLETTRNPHNNKNPTKFMRSIPLTKLPPLLHKFKGSICFNIDFQALKSGSKEYDTDSTIYGNSL